jgi:hypothetical protein
MGEQWEVLDYSDGKKGFIAIVNGSEHIADVFPFGTRPGGADRALERHKANARLIAAAPDLLLIAKRAAVHFEGTDGDLGNDALAAIAKAEGAAFMTD